MRGLPQVPRCARAAGARAGQWKLHPRDTCSRVWAAHPEKPPRPILRTRGGPRLSSGRPRPYRRARGSVAERRGPVPRGARDPGEGRGTFRTRFRKEAAAAWEQRLGRRPERSGRSAGSVKKNPATLTATKKPPAPLPPARSLCTLRALFAPRGFFLPRGASRIRGIGRGWAHRFTGPRPLELRVTGPPSRASLVVRFSRNRRKTIH